MSSNSIMSPSPAPGSTLSLGEADESRDLKRLYENYEKPSFGDWPNEAGFDGMTEHRGPVELPVRGKIPAWAVGSLYRTGPGNRTIEGTKSGTFRIDHWFDGLAHTHRFDIVPAGADDGKAKEEPAARVLYSSRRQCDAVVEDIKKHGVIRAISFGQRRDPCVGMFSKITAVFRRPDPYENICVTVNPDMPGLDGLAKAPKAPKAVGNGAATARSPARTALLGTDTKWLCEIDAQTMEPLGYMSLTQVHPLLRGPMGPAHSQVDPETGDSFNVNINFGRVTEYRVYTISKATGQTTVLATFTSAPAYLHSLFLTRSYVVVCVPAAHLSLGGVGVLWEGALLEAFNPFDHTQTCRWFVVDRRRAEDGGKGVLAEYTSPAAFFFHSVNAFEDPASGDVVCDLVSYPDTRIVSQFYYDVLLNRDGAAERAWASPAADGLHPSLARWRLRRAALAPDSTKEGSSSSSSGGLPAATCDLAIPAPHAGDIPTINPAYRLRPYRFVYSLVSRGLSTLFDGVARTDLQTRAVLLWAAPQGHTPGEAIFVARPGATAEDDGVLLSVVLDGHAGASYLLCLDAHTMTELGRAECGFAVGFGFHGAHVTAQP